MRTTTRWTRPANGSAASRPPHVADVPARRLPSDAEWADAQRRTAAHWAKFADPAAAELAARIWHLTQNLASFKRMPPAVIAEMGVRAHIEAQGQELRHLQRLQRRATRSPVRPIVRAARPSSRAPRQARRQRVAVRVTESPPGSGDAPPPPEPPSRAHATLSAAVGAGPRLRGALARRVRGAVNHAGQAPAGGGRGC